MDKGPRDEVAFGAMDAQHLRREGCPGSREEKIDARPHRLNAVHRSERS
jgi:hypothetical protein